MRELIALNLLLVLSAPLAAQTDQSAASLRSLNFLQGVWIAPDNGAAAKATEFHWRESQSNLFMVGRTWLGRENGCPWCVAKTAMAFWYDPTSRQVRLHLADRAHHVLDLHLISAGERTLQFLSDRQPSMPVYRLTYTESESGILSATLEKEVPNMTNSFVSVAETNFRRR